MPKCLMCGKKGLFLKLDESGRCPSCHFLFEHEQAELRAKENARLSAERAERRRLDREEQSKIAQLRIAEERTRRRKMYELEKLQISSDIQTSCSEDYSLIPDCVITDIETTGLSWQSDSITEISAIKISGGKVVDFFSKLIKQDRPLPMKIVSLTGINDEILDEIGEDKESVITDYVDFLGDLPVVGHNIDQFDSLFISKAYLDLSGSPLKNETADTLTMSRAVIPMSRKHTLEYLGNYTKICSGTSHRAMGDCITTLNLYKYMIDLANLNFFKWSKSGKPLYENDLQYPKYVTYVYPKGMAHLFQQKLIENGYFNTFDTIKTLMLSELKDILKKHSLPTSGTKPVLVERIHANIDVDSLGLENTYVPSEKGRAYVEKYQAILKSLPDEYEFY